MTQQPQSLFLAECADVLHLYATAAELRRLHAENKKLKQHLESYDHCETDRVINVSNKRNSMNKYEIYKPPQPVGFWVLYEVYNPSIQFPIFNKPTDEQIKNTEELLGWRWRDAPEDSN